MKEGVEQTFLVRPLILEYCVKMLILTIWS